MPAGDVFGLDGFFLNKSNPVTVSTIGINSTGSSAGIEVVSGTFSSGTVTLTFATGAGITTTPFYTGTKIAVSGLSNDSGVAHTGYNGTFVVTGFTTTTTVSYATTGYVGSVSASITALGLVMLVTDTAVTNTTWTSAQTHGWFGGGQIPATVSTVDRIDFSNDTGTANIRGPLTSTRYKTAATGNSNYGWFGGGGPGPVSIVNRINFSNDSTTAAPRGSLSLSRQYLAATGNSNYGWFGGGAPATAIVDRIDFSNDSGVSLVRGSLNAPNGRFGLAATGNSNYGWFGGGFNTLAAVSLVDRIDFSNDSPSATPRGVLSQARWYLTATGNSNYGWFGGGTTTGTSGVVTIDRIDFANDSSTASSRGSLSAGKYFLAATGNSNYGWFGGGANPTPAVVSTVERIDFSNDSVSASPRGPLSSPSPSPAGKIDLAATSGQARSSSIRLQKAGNYGWFGGGQGDSPVVILATVDRIDFSNDTPTASPRTGTLSAARYQSAATGNSNYGWFGGGFAGGLPSAAIVDRVDFSNDSISASVRGPLSQARFGASATGNSNYGWFGGGRLPGLNFYSTVDRIDFSNDSGTASPRGGPLTALKAKPAATGNSNYGWFGGGYSPSIPGETASIDRVDFSNDSISASVRGSLSLARFGASATGNSNYGWFGGGSPTTATVNCVNFSNDSVTVSVRGPLSQGRYNLAATGNSNYGWFGGGQINSPTYVSRVDRIDFSNDSATASVRGSITPATGRGRLAATSNSTR